MRPLILLPLVGALCACTARHDAEQVVHKDPAVVYAAFDSAFGDAVEQGNSGSAAEDGQVSTIERVPNKSLDLKVMMDGRQAISMRFGFEPINGGAETRLTGDIDVDQDLLRASLRKKHGSDAALPNIPDFAFKMLMQKLLSEAANDIEHGEPLSGARRSLAMASEPQEASTDPAERRYQEEWKQRQATQPISNAEPMVDPDADARKYLSGGSDSED
jgi:hypothetical protein